MIFDIWERCANSTNPCLFILSDILEVFLQSIFKFNDEKIVTGITISKPKLVIMVMFDLMIKRK